MYTNKPGQPPSFIRLLNYHRLNTDHLPPVLTEKKVRSLKLKKRRDRKRRIQEADGGRCDGDMRLVSSEIVDGGKKVSRILSPCSCFSSEKR
jgi:hypothetical protein